MTTMNRSNKGRNLAFRNDVILYLHDLGYTSADRRIEAKGLSLVERDALASVVDFDDPALVLVVVARAGAVMFAVRSSGSSWGAGSAAKYQDNRSDDRRE